MMQLRCIYILKFIRVFFFFFGPLKSLTYTWNFSKTMYYNDDLISDVLNYW